MGGKALLATREDGDDEIPDLTENFAEAFKNETNWIESTSEDETWSYWVLLFYIKTTF